MPDKKAGLDLNLTLEQIYQTICPECRDKVLDLAASEGVKQLQERAKHTLVEGLKKSLKS